ncbi:hypothetical protein BDP27DRAFT_1405513 [Rhodocollybia butyracea]|uniref:Uncharacterized protein n=1 Tax=Rhodocollybia butyracea TaxID=206335 RepID=A0A9P5PIJ5_9AGAR|nr:hypothetical protein BDP27DRAFT_1405513 [Rhodocollybia butyracea]
MHHISVFCTSLDTQKIHQIKLTIKPVWGSAYTEGSKENKYWLWREPYILYILYNIANTMSGTLLTTAWSAGPVKREPVRNVVVQNRNRNRGGGAKQFTKSTPVGGDPAGQAAEEAVNAAEQELSESYRSDSLDLALAQQLQADALGRTMQQMRQKKEREAQRQQAEEEKSQKKKKDCIIIIYTHTDSITKYSRIGIEDMGIVSKKCYGDLVDSQESPSVKDSNVPATSLGRKSHALSSLFQLSECPPDINAVFGTDLHASSLSSVEPAALLPHYNFQQANAFPVIYHRGIHFPVKVAFPEAVPLPLPFSAVQMSLSAAKIHACKGGNDLGSVQVFVAFAAFAASDITDSSSHGPVILQFSDTSALPSEIIRLKLINGDTPRLLITDLSFDWSDKGIAQEAAQDLARAIKATVRLRLLGDLVLP